MGKKNFRQSAPFGDTQAMKVTYEMTRGDVELVFGTDGDWESHTAEITDPTNDRFFIMNFNDVKRDRMGFFSQATWSAANWDLEAGLRYNRVSMDADDVGGDLGMMSPQQERLDKLAAEFNAKDRSKKDDQWSGIFKVSRPLGEAVRLNLGLGRKVRSPSYQERYLWLPMEATAGLADGHTYIGDINLKPENSFELTAGFDWSTGGFQTDPGNLLSRR